MVVQSFAEATRRPAPSFTWAVPLIPATVSGFCLSALFYYHVQVGATDPSGPLQGLVAGLYDLLGFVPAVMFALLAFVWSTIWYVSGHVERPTHRLLRVLALTVTLSILLGMQPQPEAEAGTGGGLMGTFLATRLESAVGYVFGTLVVSLSVLFSLLLATDVMFYRYFESMARSGAPTRRRAGPEDGVEVEAVQDMKGLDLAGAPRVAGPAVAVLEPPAEIAPRAPARRIPRAPVAVLEAPAEEAPLRGWRARAAARAAAAGEQDEAAPTPGLGAHATETDEPADDALAAVAEAEDARSTTLEDEDAARRRRDDDEDEEKEADDDDLDDEDEEDDDEEDDEDEDYDDEEEEEDEDDEDDYDDEDEDEDEDEDDYDYDEDDDEYEDDEDDEDGDEEDPEARLTAAAALNAAEAEVEDVPDLENVVAASEEGARAHAADEEGLGEEQAADEAEDAVELPRPAPAAPVSRQRSLFASPEADEALLDEATVLVCSTQRASVTFLQRRLRIGFDEARATLEALRAAGVVGGEPGDPQGEVLLDEASAPRRG